MNFNVHQVKWAASECERQQVSPLLVVDLLHALHFARVTAFGENNNHHLPTLENMMQLGRYVDPSRNAWYSIDNGNTEINYRVTPVMFQGGGGSCQADLIPDAIDRLWGFVEIIGEEGAITIDEFITHFLYIHPFEDGNGRVASVLYNWLNRTLDEPVPLPSYDWGTPQHHAGHS